MQHSKYIPYARLFVTAGAGCQLLNTNSYHSMTLRWVAHAKHHTNEPIRANLDRTLTEHTLVCVLVRVLVRVFVRVVVRAFGHFCPFVGGFFVRPTFVRHVVSSTLCSFRRAGSCRMCSVGPSFVRSVVHSVGRAFVCTFIRALVHAFGQWMCTFVRVFVPSCVRSSVNPCHEQHNHTNNHSSKQYRNRPN